MGAGPGPDPGPRAERATPKNKLWRPKTGIDPRYAGFVRGPSPRRPHTPCQTKGPTSPTPPPRSALHDPLSPRRVGADTGWGWKSQAQGSRSRTFLPAPNLVQRRGKRGTGETVGPLRVCGTGPLTKFMYFVLCVLVLNDFVSVRSPNLRRRPLLGVLPYNKP